MEGKFDKKQTYEFCEIRKVMVRIDLIQATVQMPDMVQAELRLIPVNCNRAEECRLAGRRCMVIVEGGEDPFPNAEFQF